MVVISSNQLITINRGDTFEVPLFISVKNMLTPLRYILKAGDKIYFNVMEANVPFEDATIKKEYTSADLNENGDVIVEFTHEDTMNLNPGNYYYEVKFEHIKTGEKTIVNTIIPRRKFIIVE